ncbi:MAG TPA: putative porin [Ginsengibacter sp.]|nr:putative porin [Ginsengibacter sp.]
MITKPQIKFFLPALQCITLLLAMLLFSQASHAQMPNILRNRPNFSSPSRSTNAKGQTKGDSLSFQHRDDLADSITIYFRYLDSLKNDFLDSSLDDFNKFYTVPANYVTLGNNGTAAYPVLFSPLLQSGWDAGFHSFDVYKYSVENTRFFKTTRPFTQMTYLLGSGKEQVIKVLHTQNIKPNWNAGFEYQLISSPGIFQTQNSNINNYRFFSNYQGKRKRYAAYFVLLGNKINVSENGGIRNDSFLLDPQRKKRFAVPVNLGGDVGQTFNVFSTKVNTGDLYSNFTALFRQSYDFGIKDSLIINDSTTEYLFYPKFRFQHTINYSSYGYQFQDKVSGYQTYTGIRNAALDSAYFHDRYDTTLNLRSDSLNFRLQDKWKFVSNDFSIKQFPETKNPAQFIETGIRLENFSGEFLRSKALPQLVVLPAYRLQFSFLKKTFYNVVLHGEYRNKTRNKKWDALLKGDFYATGFNAGDYSAYATLNRFLNPKLGNIQVSFQNVNRSPSYIFNGFSSFDVDNTSLTKKENLTVISAMAFNPRFTIMARNISITNYTYLKNYYQTDQFNGLLNITQVTASTKNKVVGHLNLYSDFIVQQSTGTNPIRVPLLFTRQRLAFEGNFYKNLFLSTGLDVKYNTPYKAYNYSPVMGHFFPQDSVTISNLPELDFYFDFRIKSFTGVVKLENLNTVNFTNGFDFTNNSFAAPNYPTPGLIFRIGVQWNFVN